MLAESKLKLAAYFERRASRARGDERERFLAIAKSYRAKTIREREPDQDSSTHPEH